MWVKQRVRQWPLYSQGRHTGNCMQINESRFGGPVQVNYVCPQQCPTQSVRVRGALLEGKMLGWPWKMGRSWQKEKPCDNITSNSLDFWNSSDLTSWKCGPLFLQSFWFSLKQHPFCPRNWADSPLSLSLWNFYVHGLSILFMWISWLGSQLWSKSPWLEFQLCDLSLFIGFFRTSSFLTCKMSTMPTSQGCCKG